MICWQYTFLYITDQYTYVFYRWQQLREAFDRDALTTGRSRLLITAAVAAGKKNIDSGYDVPALGRYYIFTTMFEIQN